MGQGMRKRPETLQTLSHERTLRWVCGCRLARSGLRNDTFIWLDLDHVAGLVPQPLCGGESIDKRLGPDGQEALLKALVEKLVTSFADDQIGDVIQCLGREVGQEVASRRVNQLPAKISNGALRDGGARMVDSGIELRTG